MFRKPRDAVAQIAIETPIKPSTGRPPTPPLSAVQPNLQDNTSPVMSMMNSTTPPVGRTRALPKNNARTPSFAGKAKGKPNGSILNFFKKADSILPFNVSVTEEEDSLFLQDSPGKHETKVPVQTPTPPREYGHPESSPSMLIYTAADQESSRLNEDSMPVKRRRVDGPPSRSSSSPNIKVEAGPKTGPFLEDSDSGHEMVKHESRSIDSESEGQGDQASTTPKSELDVEEEPPAIDSKNSPPVPSLQRENTSMVDSDDFEGIEDFDDEFPEEGEEFLERQWMEEQKELELGFEDEEIGQDPGGEKDTLENAKDDIQDPGAASCPICSGSFAGLTDQVRRERPFSLLCLIIP